MRYLRLAALDILIGSFARLAMAILVFALPCVLALTARADEDGPGVPDGRGEAAVAEPRYRGESVKDPIPPSMHTRNEGGSDGAGLCVISSVLTNGRHAGIPALQSGKGSDLWRTAKRRPGGYGPEKLAALVEQAVPGEKWASHVGRDPQVLDSLSRAGYKIGATMSTGALYGYRPIHHMISLDQYRSGGLAWVVDNNRPGFWSVMPAREFDRRWLDGGIGWAWIWTRKHPVQAGASALAAIAVFTLAAIVATAGKARRLELEKAGY